ncbi:MAG: Ref family recombination enhancement nuclease [Elusimicrobiales bacterium]
MIRKKGLRRRHRAIGPPTLAEQAYQDAQRANGCAMCRLLGLPPNACGPVRVHHRTTGDLHGQKQLGQAETVGLGDWHHQGIPLSGRQEESMRRQFGPSLQLHKRAFVELLQEQLGERSTEALQRFQDGMLDPALVRAIGR